MSLLDFPAILRRRRRGVFGVSLPIKSFVLLSGMLIGIGSSSRDALGCWGPVNGSLGVSVPHFACFLTSPLVLPRHHLPWDCPRLRCLRHCQSPYSLHNRLLRYQPLHASQFEFEAERQLSLQVHIGRAGLNCACVCCTSSCFRFVGSSRFISWSHGKRGVHYEVSDLKLVMMWLC